MGRLSEQSGVSNSTADSLLLISFSSDSGSTYTTRKIRVADLFDDIELDWLADVSAPSPSSGQVLAWNGTAWAPTTPASNVQADWDATSGAAQILNKPTIPTNNNQLTNGAGYITSADGGNAGLLDGLDSTQFLRSDAADSASGTISFSGIVNINSTSNRLTFGSFHRQSIYLYGSTNAIGTQTNTTYFRSNSRFSWFRGGSQSLNENQPGSGGTVAMTLDGSSNLTVAGNITASGGTVNAVASTAYKWQTARTITLAGDLSGNVSLDGSANVTLTAAVADDSHNHVISNVDGLQSALDGKADLVGGVLNTSQLPDIAVTEYLGSVSNQTGMLALSGQKGDWCARSDDGKVYVITGTDPSQAGSWTALSYPVAAGTNLGVSAGSSTVAITSSTGNNTTFPAATTTTAGGMTAADKSKLDGIAAGAEVNVQSDWNASSGDAAILNKPTIPTNNNQLTNGAGYITSSGSISGNAATATKLATARNFTLVGDLSGVASFDGSANVTLNAQVANNSHNHTLSNVTDSYKLFQPTEGHTTYTSFATAGSGMPQFGFRFVQGSTNGPGVNSAGQYYRLYTGLGSDYSNTQYGMEVAIPRNVSSPYIAIRYNENGSLGSWQKVSAGYADSAGYLSTARTISLSGDATGSASFNGSANISIPVTIADDSHNHVISNIDGLQTALDGKLSTTGKAADSNALDGIDSSSFLRSDAADTATGNIAFEGNVSIATATNQLSFGSNVRQMINLYSSGYGIGVQSSTTYFRSAARFSWHRGGSHSNTENNPGSGGTTAMTLDNSSNLTVSGNITASGGTLNGTSTSALTAAKLTNARSISLAGDVTGSVNFDGSANVSITATVADDSHNHTIANVDGLQTALDGKLGSTAKAADSNLLDGIDSTGFIRTTYNSSLNSDSRNSRGVTRLYRRDNDSDYSVQTYWTGTYWRLYGYNGDNNHADTYCGVADRLATARSITLAGDVTGTATFNGTANISITATVADDSHNHTIANVDGLQTALDGKSATTHNHTYNVNDAWLRENGDNANFKIYGNTRQVVFRTDGQTEYASGVGAYAFAWMYGGDASGNRRMLLNSNGDLWTSTNGWLSTALAGKLSTTGNAASATTAASCSGNAATATALETAQYINGVSFDGTGQITVEPYIQRDDTTNTARCLTFVDNSTAAYKRLKMDADLTYNPSTNILSTSISGNAATATTLQTARTISLTGDVSGSVSFNGSANVSISATVADDSHSHSNYLGDGVNAWQQSSDGRDRIYFANASHSYWKSSGNHYWRVNNTNTEALTLDTSGNLTALGDVTAYSDISLKENIETIEEPLSLVRRMRGVRYDRNDIQDNRKHVGVIAQEMEQVLPEVVNVDENGLRTVAYGNINGVLIEAIKQLEKQVVSQYDLILKLQSEIQELRG